jgi:hypothetical protein
VRCASNITQLIVPPKRQSAVATQPECNILSHMNDWVRLERSRTASLLECRPGAAQRCSMQTMSNYSQPAEHAQVTAGGQTKGYLVVDEIFVGISLQCAHQKA